MKTLYRSSTNKKIAGICGGIAEYFQLDPTLIRIIWLSSVLMGGTGILVYVICWIIVPEKQNSHVISAIQSSPLRRSLHNKRIAGVCGGLGEHFKIDPIIMRIGFLILALCGVGWGILLYIILWIALPLEEELSS
jgi:phage shock protein C